MVFLHLLPMPAQRMAFTWGVVAYFLLSDFPVPENLASLEECRRGLTYVD
jgi:hypothetical protein